jgi:DNA modification methylase
MTDDLLSLKYIPISQAELFDSNAKLHNLDQIIQSIARYGFKSACKWESTLNDGRGGIVAGNGRVEALRVMEERGDDLPIGIAQDETGEWCVPVLFGVEAESEAIARAYALDDNNLTLLGGDFAVADLMKLYDQELLLSELEELSQYDEVPVSIGEADLDELLNQLASAKGDKPEPEYEEDDPTVPEDIQVREGVELGSIWALGRHRIMCSDSTIEANIRKLMGDRFDDIGMVWADVPYGYCYQSNMRTKTQKFDVLKNDDVFLDGFILPLLKTSGWFCICTTWKVLNKWMEISSPLGDLTNLIVWDKGGGGMGDLAHSLSTDYELIMAFGRGTEIYGKRIGSVWSIGKDKPSDYLHPTQKPVELLAQAFETFTDNNCIIFDPFLGSAPSIAAAQIMTGRRTVYGVELDPRYIEVACQRYETLTGDIAKRIS